MTCKHNAGRFLGKKFFSVKKITYWEDKFLSLDLLDEGGEEEIQLDSGLEGGLQGYLHNSQHYKLLITNDGNIKNELEKNLCTT